jgi:SagB-type dehydrogenase family enzyme
MYQGSLEGKPKYQYASPGGLYPTQVYLHIKSGRVAGIEAGVYYYHPIEHRLIAMTQGVEIDRTIHIPFINTPIFDEAAFSLFFITQLSAIAPSYGEQSIHFATLEAGIMAHHMEMSSPEYGIGLCQIGSVDFDRIRNLFNLDKTHFVVHTSLGGRVDEERGGEGIGAFASLGNTGKAAKTLQRLKGLSSEEVKAMLEAKKAAKQEGTGQ